MIGPLDKRKTEANNRILHIIKRELRGLCFKAKYKVKHDRMIKIEHSYMLLENNLELEESEQQLKAWEVAITTHWS